MTQDFQLISSAWWKLPWWAILVVVAFLAMALFGERGVLRVMDVSRQKDLLQREMDRLSEQNSRLDEEIRGLRSDRRLIEDIARRDLGMVRENEIIYVFPTKDKVVTAHEISFPPSAQAH